MTTTILYAVAVVGRGGPVKSLGTVLPEIPGVRRSVVAPLHKGEIPAPLAEWTHDFRSCPRARGLGLLRSQLVVFSAARAARNTLTAYHANGLTEAVMVLPASLLIRRPVVVWGRSAVLPRPFRIAVPILRRLAHYRWFAVARAVEDALVDGGFDREQIGRIPNAVNPATVSTERPARTPQHRPLQLTYLAGTDRAIKGFDLLPDLIEATDDLDVTWHVYAARSPEGDASAWQRLEQLAGKRLEIHEPVNDVRPVYDSTDVVVCPSRSEAMPRVVIESMANGIAVAASHIDAHVELLEESGAGRTFDHNQPRQLRSILKNWTQDDQERLAAGLRGRAAVADLTPAKIGRKLLDAYGL